jgi:hypothetical protein
MSETVRFPVAGVADPGLRGRHVLPESATPATEESALDYSKIIGGYLAVCRIGTADKDDMPTQVWAMAPINH